MSLNQRIKDEMKAALIGGNRFDVDTLRGLRASILHEEVARGERDKGLDDTEIEKIIVREVKKRNESAKIYRQNDRLELAESEEKEAEILKKFLPKQMSEEEISKLVDEKISEFDKIDMSIMGKVIGTIKSEVGSSVDGAILAKIVKEKLSK